MALMDNKARNAAVDAYKTRSGLLYEILTLGTPDENEVVQVTVAHAIIGRAIEAEMFGDPSTHMNLLLDTDILIW